MCDDLNVPLETFAEEGGRNTDFERAHVAARKIAEILEENEATVNDMALIFKTAKKYMVVKGKYTMRNSFESFGKIIVPDNTHDGDGIGDK